MQFLLKREPSPEWILNTSLGIIVPHDLRAKTQVDQLRFLSTSFKHRLIPTILSAIILHYKIVEELIRRDTDLGWREFQQSLTPKELGDL